MRKTYRSKKDTTGALDHRDVLLTTDAKSSLFDAFYIQNLKQTKRDVSVSTMQFAASNKVRKRKYVRRVKENTPPPIESMTSFAYLTPDKSLHVNKAPDLFDQLLNSSPADVKKEVCKNIKIQDKRCYSGVNRKNKKINCWSSDSSDSDKENSNANKNSSDIKQHKLIIENKSSPHRIDESIVNIFNNLSALKLDDNFSPINKDKSPIISKVNKNQLNGSPLCSTPFNKKYRGKSIYKFSPIGVNFENSPKEQSGTNKILEILGTVNKKDISTNADDSCNEIIENNSECCIIHCEKTSNVEHNVVRAKSSTCLSEPAQSTYEEPFLGFSNILQENNANKIKRQIYNSCLENLYSVPEGLLDSSQINQENDLKEEIDFKFKLDNNLEENNEIPSTNATSSSICNETDNESLYDTCSSEELDNSTKPIITTISKEPVIVLNKLNNSVFEKYYKQMPDYNIENQDDISNKSKSTQSDNSGTEEFLSGDENKSHINVTNNEMENFNNELENPSDVFNLDENCMSFVTTRRRNKVTNDFTILALDNSYNINDNIDIGDCDNVLTIENVITEDNNLDQDINNCEVIERPSINFTMIGKGNTIITRNRFSLVKNNETREDIPFEEIEDVKPSIVLQPGKKWERSLSIYRRMTTMADHFDQSILDKEDLKSKGRKYRQSVICTMELQDTKGRHNNSFNSRRSTFSSKSRPSIKRIKETEAVSRLSVCSTNLEEFQGFLNEDCDDTVIELSNLSIADCDPEVTVIENIHDTSHRGVTAREIVLRRCDQTDAILFDECYPDTALKNCRKIGEGVYGEVFLWRARDGRARVLKVIPVGGNIKVNGENQKDFGEIISEIVIAMELSALRTPIADIVQHLDEGKDIETLDLHSVVNATDVFNEVLAVRCVYGSYPSRLLDLWDLYDECKGSENDNPETLPVDQQFIVLELANAGQDLESYQFTNAEQAYSIFKQCSCMKNNFSVGWVAYGLAVAEEAFQFEHRDLHWGNVLIQESPEPFTVFVLRGRAVRVPRRGVAASLIDYSLSRVSLRARGSPLALYHDLGAERELFEGQGDYQFDLYRLMRRALRNNWEEYEPYTNVLWLHYTIDKMITSLRYSRPNTKIHKQYINKLQVLKEQLLSYRSATELVLTNNEL